MQFGKCGIKNLLGEENMDNLILDKSKAFARRFDTMRTIFAEYNNTNCKVQKAELEDFK